MKQIRDENNQTTETTEAPSLEIEEKIEEKTIIPMNQIEVVITEKEGTIHPDEYDHVENIIPPVKTHIGAVLKQWSGSCQKHPGCLWDLLCDCSNCEAITARSGF